MQSTIPALVPYGGPWLVAGFMLVFFFFMFYLSKWWSGGFDQTKSRYLVADRELGLWQTGMSVGASYIWAPAMFISATRAYEQGFVGFSWYMIGNIIALLLYALLVNRVINRFPGGFTLSDFMGVQHSERVRGIFWLSLIGLTIGAFATQLLAGGLFIKFLTGMDYFWATVLLTAVPFLYCVFFGFKASVITDMTKMAVMAVVAIVGAWWIAGNVGVDTVITGMNGVTGEFVSFFDDKGLMVATTFGIAALIGLTSGTAGDQALWQRAFAVKDPNTRRNGFLLGTLFYCSVPFAMAVIGFAAAGAGFKIAGGNQYINVAFIADQLPIWAVMAFGIMILMGITSILDSKMSALSCIAGHDIAKKIHKDPTDKQAISIGKWSMVILCLLAIGIANIPGVKLVHLFLSYGAIRASTALPTLIVMWRGKPLHEPGVFWGCLISMFVGVPMLIYGTLNTIPWATVSGMAFAFFFSGLLAYFWTKSIEKSTGKELSIKTYNELAKA